MPQTPTSPQPPYQPGLPGPPPKKGLSTGATLGIVFGAIGTLLCAAGIFFVVLFWPNDEPSGRNTGTPSTGSSATKPRNGHVIRFEVTAESGTALLVNWSTVEDAALERDVAASTDKPWVKEVTLETRTGLVGVNVTGTGKVSCKLLVDGQVVDEGESEGVVNCSKAISP